MLIALIFAILTVVGESYKKIDSWDIIIQNPIRTISLVLIYTIIFYILIKGLKKIFYKIGKKEEKVSKITEFIFEKHPYTCSFIIILLVWLPIIIIKYPGTPGWDFYYFLNNYYEYDKGLTQHFPLIYVFFCVYTIKFGLLLKNAELGLYLLTILHGITMLIAFALTFKYLKKWKINYKFRYFLLIFYCLNPLFSNYFTTIYHDVPYSAFILIYVLILTDIYIEKTNISMKKIIILGILSILICWTRKNGIYIILPINIFIAIKYMKNSKKNIEPIVMIIPIILFYMSEWFFTLHYFPTSLLEVVSIPIQTISRYSRDFNQDITIEEEKDIDGFINYNLAGKLYNPTLVDPARNNAGNYFATNEEKIKFFKVWFELFFRHPTPYIQAVINNTYELYYPFENSTYIFTKVKDDEKYDTIIEFKRPESLEEINEKLEKSIVKFEQIPILCYLDDPGIYSWIFIALMAEIIKRKENILPTIPIILTFIICIMGPTIDLNTRYTFPIIFSIFPLAAFYSYTLKNKKIE